MSEEQVNLSNPDYYQNREVSWLDFNERVILEAEDETNPLLEQITFLAIGSSNLDEFMQVRVAGLQDQVKFGLNPRDNKKQWTAEEQLAAIAEKNEGIVQTQYQLYHQKMQELEKLNVKQAKIFDQPEKAKRELRQMFEESIEPAITPYGIDAYRPFPHLSNGVIHLFIRLEKAGDPYIAIIPIPQLLDRIYLLEEAGERYMVFIEDIVRLYLADLFIGYDVQYTFAFRISRNADLELQEEGADDLLSVIENYLELRRNGMAVRLEVDTRHVPAEFTNDVAYLVKELDLAERDVYAIDGPLDLTFLNDLVDLLEDEYPEETFRPFKPTYPAILQDKNIFEVADQQDIFLHHPFDSFKPVIQLVEEAADDPNTVAIKQTLYRVSSTSPLIAALKRAAKRGVQVTALVELKARFDEENNVHWAKELEEAGVHILYGMKELKTHSKATLIVKSDGEGFKRYVHLGTGNYNEKTARGYTDMGLITTHEEITQDVADFFNYLSGYSERPDYTHIYVSPFDIRDSFIDLIDEEIESHRQHGNGHIVAKMNSLTDKKMILKLFEASRQGVQVDLIIRGICCLVPGIPGVSENITVRSVVGRFLEHTRIYYFHGNGQEKLYLSSADLMTRNLSKRVEIAFPILDGEIRAEIIDVLKLYLADNTKAWQLEGYDGYKKLRPKEGEEALSAQMKLMENAILEYQESKQVEEKNWFAKLSEKLLRNRRS